MAHAHQVKFCNAVKYMFCCEGTCVKTTTPGIAGGGGFMRH